MTILGIAFPFQAGSTSFPAVSTDADVVEDNIMRILLTTPGERPMRPGVGCQIYSFIFENMGSVLNARVDHEVRRAIGAGETRARVVFTQVREDTLPNKDKNTIVDVWWEFNSEVRHTAVPYGSAP